MNKSGRILLPTAVVCLLISGAAGLVYQVVWMRYLALFLGHTSYAVVAVLVAFMGGLALGNVWLGARADRVRRPLALYAWLEIGIGVYALVFPLYFEVCQRLYVVLARGWSSGHQGALALKFGFSLLTILGPTILMGGTLPVMTRLVTRSLGELRERVATLYFVNSLGAVGGCFLADFLWIPAIGLQSCVFAGAAMNLLVGAVALSVSSWLKEGPLTSAPAAEASAPEEIEEYSAGELRLAVVGIGVSGFVAMLYEVVWTRLLALALGSSTHAFSIMLITFITGIATGAWIVARWRGLRRTLDAFAWAELALAVTLFASMFFYDLIPYWFSRIAGMLVRQPEVYPLYELVQGLICFAVMFVPTVCLGMTLPLVSRVATAELRRTGRSVGAVFSVNTLGTVLGAAVSGLWLLPQLGLARTLALGIALNSAVGLVVLARRRRALLPVLGVAVPALTVALVVLAGLLFEKPWEAAFIQGLWRIAPLPSREVYRKVVEETRVEYYRDGAGSTVAITGGTLNGRPQFTLTVNGKPDAGTFRDVPTQLLSGHLPMLLRPGSREVLVIGLGSGMTAGAVSCHPGLERLDIVEISPEVVEASRFFRNYNADVLNQPKVHLTVDDAKSFLLVNEQRYDVIISEPSNPWMAGVAGVFSLEYYQRCRTRLQPDGLMVQWIQAYESNDEVLQTVLKTFGSVFPHLSVWSATPGDLIVVGSAQPVNADLASMPARLAEPRVRLDLERMDLFRLPVLLSREIISADNAPHLAEARTRVHSDYYPILEYLAQRAFFVRSGATLPITFDENRSRRPATLLGEYLRRQPLVEKDFDAFGLFRLSYETPDGSLFRSLLSRWLQDFPGSTNALELSAQTPYRGSGEALEAQRMRARREWLWNQAARDPSMLRAYANTLLQTYRGARSVFFQPPGEELSAALQRLLETDPANQRVHRLHLAELAWDRQDDLACFQFARQALDPDTAAFGPIRFDLDPTAPHRVMARMIDTLWRAGQTAEAWELCRQAIDRGYVGPPSAARDPWLELVCRKVEAHVTQSSAPAPVPR